MTIDRVVNLKIRCVFGLLKLRLAERIQTLGANRPVQITAVGLLQQNCCLICEYEGPL